MSLSRGHSLSSATFGDAGGGGSEHGDGKGESGGETASSAGSASTGAGAHFRSKRGSWQAGESGDAAVAVAALSLARQLDKLELASGTAKVAYGGSATGANLESNALRCITFLF